MDKQELKILEILDTIVRREPVRTVIDSIVSQIESRLTQDSRTLLAWQPVSLANYGGRLPGGIRSSWVFAVRAQSRTGAEKHPNSYQRMMSYRGSGDLQIWTVEGWRSNNLVSDSKVPIESRWISIPSNTWHQAVVAKENWIVVSFHTVIEDELIEERSNATNTELTHRRTYLNTQNE